jgi:hypothetical protein
MLSMASIGIKNSHLPSRTKVGFELGESQSINIKKIQKIQINIDSILTKYQQININFIDFDFQNIV